MEKLCFAYRKQLARTGLACVLGLSAPLTATSVVAQESAVQKELNRRLNNARKAHELLKTGDTAYQERDYKAAVQHYSQAFDLLPVGALNHDLRAAAAERYATAATERSRALAKGGNYDKARNLLNTVLKPGVAPAHLGALKLKQQIDDPIRYNHAITPEHVEDVVKVGRLLREAEGFYSLGQYDRALTVYQAVLRIDPFNKAARRSMERINVTKSDYYRAARDHSRADLLSRVDQAWETYVPAAADTLPVAPLNDPSVLAPDLRDKLAGITVDFINLDNVSLDEALDFVRLQSRLGDAPDAAGEKSGINIILNTGDPNSDIAKKIQAARVTIKARGLPLSKVIEYITDQTHTQWRIDSVGVLITPLGSTDGELISKTFRVPPNFLQSSAVGKKDTEKSPFDEDDNEDGKLPVRMNITDFLKQNGVSFPDGATASYIAASNSLTVRNTPANIDLVDQLVSLIADEEPVQVITRTTIMRISEEKLKELGFDWAITPLGLGGGLHLGGGTTGNGQPLGTLPQPPFTNVLSNPLTAGNRSGNGATAADSISSFINASNTGDPSDNVTRAPGILSVTAVTNGMVIQMLMRGLNQQTGTDVLVKPSTITRSGEVSKVEVIREFIYPTEYEPPELPNNTFGALDPATGIQVGAPLSVVTPANPTAFETRNVGVTLEVEPNVGVDRKYIDLSLRPEMIEFEGFVNYGSPINGIGSALTTGRITDNRILMPVFKTIGLKSSTVTIQDGATVVLGGVMTSRKTKIEDKVPLLGDIPVAGRLFRSEADRTFREAIIITVNVELVDPTGTPWRNR